MPQLQPTCRYCTIESIQRGRGGGRRRGGGENSICCSYREVGEDREVGGGGGEGREGRGCRCKLSSEVSGMCVERWIERG